MYLVFVTAFGLLKAMLGAVPLQMVCCDGFTPSVGAGFTVTSTVIGVPLQPFADGVTVYLTTPTALFVVRV